jgi:hypothetical protein
MATRLQRIKRRYEGGEQRPLGGYLGLLSTYGGLVVGLATLGKARSAALPERIGWSDLALISVATHKASRIIAKDPVTSPLRAPFTTFKEQSGEAEITEDVIGTGMQHAVGELVTCPFCLAQWVATTFVAGMVIAPRATRLMTSVFTAVAASDMLQFVYDAAQD